MVIKKFQNLSLNEKKEVLEWRNNANIRKYMHNKIPISLEDHLKFIDTLGSGRIYLKIDDYGVVNFKIEFDYAEVGLHKNPIKQKVGNILMKTLTDYGFNILKMNRLILHVFNENIKAIRLYKKFGFIEISRKNNLIKMELVNENRKN